jgi:hypothetical protein
MHRHWLIVLAVILLASYVHAQTPQPATPDANVHLKLLFADDKTTFRIGEPIRLVMEFTADAPGYSVESVEDGQNPSNDTISITPNSGINYWVDEMTRGARWVRDYLSYQTLSTTPARVGLTLNNTMRFDQPGQYTVRVTTRRVSTGGMQNPKFKTLTTNDVSFNVVAMSDDEEQAEIKRVSALLDAKRDWQSEDNLAQQLSFLTGDASTREKVRRFLAFEQRRGNYGSHILSGLFIAKNRALVLQLLENALRDTNQPVNSSLLQTLSLIRLLNENSSTGFEPKNMRGVLNVDGDPRLMEVQNGYLVELALGLSKRTGKSLTTTAITILTLSKKNDPNRAGTTGEARRILVQNFASLHPWDQETLLRGYWDELRDPSLVGPLKQILSTREALTKNTRDMALQHLIEMSPEEARPFAVREVCDPTSLADAEILGKLSDKSLPEVDRCLVEHIKRLAASPQSRNIFLEHKAILAVRLATENIYQDVMRVYREAGSKLPLEVRASLLAYLAKQNEREGIPLIEQEVASLEEDFNFLPALTKLYYSDAIGEVLKKRLQSEQPQAASNAAYLLGVHGSLNDVAVLEARLEQWRKDWSDRVTEADENQQGRTERELVYALLHGKSWQLPEERKRELQQSCVTKLCKQSIRTQ